MDMFSDDGTSPAFFLAYDIIAPNQWHDFWTTITCARFYFEYNQNNPENSSITVTSWDPLNTKHDDTGPKEPHMKFLQ